MSALVAVPLIAASDDIGEGRNYFLSQCIACHAFACNRNSEYVQAPRLGGLFGRKAGGVEDFPGYSEGLKKSSIVWTDETLDAFLENPERIAPQSIMVDEGRIENADKRRQIIAFLKTEDPAMDLFCE